MTDAEKAKLFASVLGMGDSPVEAEAVAAFLKYRTLRQQMGWPTFVDLLQKLESTITPLQFEAVERERDALAQNVEALTQNNRSLKEREEQLSNEIFLLRASLLVSLRNLALAAVVVAIGYGGWQWMNADAIADKSPSPVIAAPVSKQAILAAGFMEAVHEVNWERGDTAPATWSIAGDPNWWVVFRGTVDETSHVDSSGHPLERRCIELFAARAVADGGGFLTPHPYFMGGWWMQWPRRAIDCQLQEKDSS